MHWNAEGLCSKNAEGLYSNQPGYSKKAELENRLLEKKVDICSIQETHLKPDQSFKVRGYQCFRRDRKDRRKGGILTLVRNGITCAETKNFMEGAEYQQLLLEIGKQKFEITNYYCPNDKPLSLGTMKVSGDGFLVVGDFNSHSQSWGYTTMDKRGEEVENWQDDNGFILLNDPKDTHTFYSRPWKTLSTPDLAFSTPDLSGNIDREVGKQLGGSDHRPVFLTMNSIQFKQGLPKARWNYKKADWGLFHHRTNVLTQELQVQGRNINRGERFQLNDSPSNQRSNPSRL